MVSLSKVCYQLIWAWAWTLYGAHIKLPLTASRITFSCEGCALQVVASFCGGICMLRLKAIQVKPGHGTQPGRNLWTLKKTHKISILCERKSLTFHIEVIIYNNKWASGLWIIVDQGNFSKWEYVQLAGLLTSHN